MTTIDDRIESMKNEIAELRLTINNGGQANTKISALEESVEVKDEDLFLVSSDVNNDDTYDSSRRISFSDLCAKIKSKLEQIDE